MAEGMDFPLCVQVRLSLLRLLFHLLQYAHWSQQGYSHKNPHKPNQDRWGVSRDVAGDVSSALLAVYDGHGPTGHDCAAFVQTQFPKLLAKLVRQRRVQKYRAVAPPGTPLYDPLQWPQLTVEEHEDCCRRALLTCNTALHEDETIDDSISGSTAIACHFHGDYLTVSNVGDSRALLGHYVEPDDSFEYEDECKQEIDDEGHRQQQPTGLVAIPLSRDQTPHRKDERQRVLKYGACIQDQRESSPASITCTDSDSNWSEDRSSQLRVATKNNSSCTITRSLGDAEAEWVGVMGEPELLTTRLNTNDKFLILASQSVFSTLSNSHILRLCAMAESPLTACQAIVREAGISQDDNDRTVMVCFLSCTRAPGPGTTEELVLLRNSHDSSTATTQQSSSSQGDEEDSREDGGLLLDDDGGLYASSGSSSW